MRDLGCPNAGSSQRYVVSGGRCVMTSNPPRHGHVLREYEFDPESPEAFPSLLESSSNRLAKTCVRTFDADNREGRRSNYAGGNSKQDISVTTGRTCERIIGQGPTFRNITDEIKGAPSAGFHPDQILQARDRFTNDAQGPHQDGQ